MLSRYMDAEMVLERTRVLTEFDRRFDVLYEKGGEEHSGRSS